jgi:hypothetical protein
LVAILVAAAIAVGQAPARPAVPDARMADRRPDRNPPRVERIRSGCFFYRQDGAAAVERLDAPPIPMARVQYQHIATLGDRYEESLVAEDSLDLLQPGRPLRTGRGGRYSMMPRYYPGDLVLTWDLFRQVEVFGYPLIPEAWDAVDGRDCLRVRLIRPVEKPQPESFSLYWIDLDRNAQIVKAEFHQGEKLEGEIEVALKEFPTRGGSA